MAVSDMQTSGYLSSNPLDAAAPKCQRIRYDDSWPRYMKTLWIEQIKRQGGSEIFWLLFAGAIQDWKETGV